MRASPIGAPGCPELARCTASTARKRMVFSMRSRSSGCSPGVGGTIGSPSEDVDDWGAGGRRQISTSRARREAARDARAAARAAVQPRLPTAHRSDAEVARELPGDSAPARERRDADLTGRGEGRRHVVDEGKIHARAPQRRDVVAGPAEEIDAQPSVPRARHQLGLGEAAQPVELDELGAQPQRVLDVVRRACAVATAGRPARPRTRSARLRAPRRRPRRRPARGARRRPAGARPRRRSARPP